MAWGEADKVVAPAPTWGASDKVVGKVNGWIDAGKSFVSGVAEGWAPIADTLIDAGPIGVLHRAANMAGLMTGKTKPTEVMAPVTPVASQVAELAYRPQTTAGKFARAVGQNTTALVAPGSVPVRMVNTIVPAVTGEAAAEGAEAMGAGERGQAVARFFGSGVGALGASVRPQNTLRPEASPAGEVQARAPQDPVSMTARAQDYRDAGIQPTLTDVVDDSGRGVIRAAANRMTPGRQAANDFATGRALDLPSRIGAQARRVMSDDPRTPDAIRSEIAAQRSSAADEAFGAVRDKMVPLPNDVKMSLNTPAGRAALEAAAENARSSLEPADRALADELDTFYQRLPDSRDPRISVGASQKISEALYDSAQAAFQQGNRNRARILNMLAESIRSNARSKVPGYDSALEGYAADSRLMSAADLGENLMTRNTDEFAADAGKLSDPERDLAMAAGRRAIERKAGENPSAAPGVARGLAFAPEQQARNRALMGDERAADLQRGMSLEASAVDNARMVQPRAGSPTHLNDADASRVADGVEAVARTGGKMLRHDWVGIGMDWLRSRGMNDAEAEQLVRLATDPAQTDAAIQAIAARRLGQDGAREFMSLRNVAAGSGGSALLLSASPAGASSGSGQDQQQR